MSNRKQIHRSVSWEPESRPRRATRKTSKVKARKLFAPHQDPQTFNGTYISTYAHGSNPFPVFVLPADPASFDAMVEQMGTASDTYFDGINHDEQSYHHGKHMDAILAAIGITRP